MNEAQVVEKGFKRLQGAVRGAAAHGGEHALPHMLTMGRRDEGRRVRNLKVRGALAQKIAASLQT